MARQFVRWRTCFQPSKKSRPEIPWNCACGGTATLTGKSVCSSVDLFCASSSWHHEEGSTQTNAHEQVVAIYSSTSHRIT
mmetsp:Transcript_6597/g.13739  ORF Transcript_6597/g.13739 Transcript_6597/m.13739 type:complete len:80 (-) Transcript_6597:200-439(-)